MDKPISLRGIFKVHQFCFTKADRVLKRDDFVKLSKIGKTVGNRFFLAKFNSSSMGKSRLGITVTKKVGNAVKRNKIKRLIREYFRLHRNELVGVWDINVIVKFAAAELSTQQTFFSLKDIFGKISRCVDY